MGLWDSREEATQEEYELAYDNLANHNYQVDYVLTHKYEKTEPVSDKNTLQGLTDFIDDHVKFTAWYAGHWHTEEKIDAKHFIIYDKPTSLL